MWYTLHSNIETKDEAAMPRPESCFPEGHYVASSNKDVIILVLIAPDSAGVVR